MRIMPSVQRLLDLSFSSVMYSRIAIGSGITNLVLTTFLISFLFSFSFSFSICDDICIDICSDICLFTCLSLGLAFLLFLRDSQKFLRFAVSSCRRLLMNVPSSCFVNFAQMSLSYVWHMFNICCSVSAPIWCWAHKSRMYFPICSLLMNIVPVRKSEL